MESNLHRAIREVLEMYGVDTSEVKGEWNIIGHLHNAFYTEGKKEVIDSVCARINSHGFKGLFDGSYELKEKMPPQ